MFEIDIINSEEQCCFCEKPFPEDMEEHQKQCPDQLPLSPYEIKRKILQRQLENLTYQHDIVASMLRYDVTVPVKNELGEDFCHNCATFEEHKRDNCLKMTRIEAFEALLPKIRYDWLNIHYQLVNVDFDERMETAEKEAASGNLNKERQLSQQMLELLQFSPSFSSMRCGREDEKEKIADVLKNQSEPFEIEKRKIERRKNFEMRKGEMKFDEYVRKTKISLSARETRNSGARVIRFHSTFKKGQQRPDTQIKMMYKV
ncbi:Protein CBG07750 [Caenorhabditis briggsae]|uniref:Uncharacterized protein n=2 Tax=Caenorhabditis briggsae TaxID=6238 RepID=A0AAE8ZR47_CAEBR|nr:Protein CBG07750 [Caenorhabditis briggsae]ULT84379.1 hypothetical protein L3Y34_013210 [Caenorhabditis briggsae]UMM43626.1 hypothetical protein L5515_019059 [Caenorhabditis briggsae]CAP27418.1 Protein CBG07750 [Caenorhabditis briggsae]